MDSPFFAGKREVKAKPCSYQADQKKNKEQIPLDVPPNPTFTDRKHPRCFLFSVSELVKQNGPRDESDGLASMCEIRDERGNSKT